MSERGEVVLRRREHDGALELRVNGVFVMDTIETSSERELARATLAAVDPATDALEVLVGGLGLGFTLAEVLTDPRVARVLVVEIPTRTPSRASSANASRSSGSSSAGLSGVTLCTR